MADGDGLQPPRDTKALVEAIGDDVYRRLRVESPPKPAPPAVDWIKIAPYACAVLVLTTTLLFAVMWRQIDQIGETSKTAAATAAAIDRIDKDRAARIAKTDARLDGIDRRIGPLDATLKDIGRLETSASQQDARLVQGREERLADTAKIVDGMNALKIEQALGRQEVQQLRAEVQQLRRSVEARRGEPGQNPFTEENRMWRRLRPPPLLRTVYRPGLDAAPIRRGGDAPGERAGNRRSHVRLFGGLMFTVRSAGGAPNR